MLHRALWRRSLRWVNVDNSVGDVLGDDFDPAQYVTNDLLITFTGQYTGMQLLLELTSGSMYQHPAGSAAAPIAGVVAAIPDLAFDTFAAQGFAATDGSALQSPLVGGGAVGMGGEPWAQFDTERINQGWNPAGGVVIFDQSDFMVARVTLSNDAIGEWGIKTSAGATTAVRYYGSVDDGRIFLDVPGDYDANGFVGQGDLNQVLLNWGKVASTVPKAWFSNPPKGLVSQNELDALLLNWGGRYAGEVAAQAIPEPTSLLMALIATLTLLRSPWTRNSATH